MNKYLFCIAISLYFHHAGAQNPYDRVSEKFIQFYNQQAPDSIFNMYTSALKEKLPIEKTRAVITGLHVQFGDMKSLDLLKQDSGFNIYKAGFSHQTMSLLLAVSPEDSLEGYRLVPYKKE